MTAIFLTVATIAAALIDGSMLELQRGGDAWRIVTCHFTHFTRTQLLWDAIAFLGLGFACERRSRRAFHATLLAGIVIIPLAVMLLDPRIGSYRGLSGLDSALFALLVVSTRNRLLGAAFIAKLAYELITGGAVFVGDVTVVPIAHLTGAIIGTVMAIWSANRERRQQARLRESASLEEPLTRSTIHASATLIAPPS